MRGYVTPDPSKISGQRDEGGGTQEQQANSKELGHRP